MGLEDIIDAAEAVGTRDQERQTVFREEFEAYEAGNRDQFPDTRDAIDAERAALDTLKAELTAEADTIEELAEHSAFLSVDQAVRHRDQTVEKLEAHNEHLQEFHDEMAAALSLVEKNLDTLEQDGPEAVDTDPEPQFERAYDALEAHNEAVDGLGTNLTILNAYLL